MESAINKVDFDDEEEIEIKEEEKHLSVSLIEI